ncbi:MotA/TolQ/ExbB proton channel family protein [Hymenobacter sp. 5516J-16]|uniref:MotA/TolQ/ExbB proton channel family protein n=3 Tax=Hymenobacteraceae TaxID=1853232 RepID=A0ABY4J9D6_9BACT|nr:MULTISPECIES: MotA/TolQ/ExbB proton channel family protein [Hymenobacter]UOQ75760.1 MotA/TolQ/ExbB proton channel family protein [Hymenobacter sp. 5516J-16]UPL49435.1 MotA/TolQ/ExbB proton channel family protein [Hymenobacter sublimis]GGG46444.1 flagellar motor protein MotA [Hymenobacter glacieicola]
MEQKNAMNKPAARPAAAAAPKGEAKGGGSSLFAILAIVLAFIVSVIIYKFVLGDASHFQGGNNENNPIGGDYFGVVYKGGPIVPLLMTMFLCVIIFSIERALTISRAKGSKSIESFVRTIRQKLNVNDITGAIAACDQQKGSVANVVKAGLGKYQEMARERNLEKDQKILAIQKEIEESTALELPMLEKNLVILSTLASIATLVGLLGTVFGMIKAFSALAQGGAPDAVGLANGISEALINTALGIGTSAIAIVAYNFFTSKIDELTYSIDEAGFSIIQTFAAQHGETEHHTA